MFGLVWDKVHLKVLWKFHQDLICFVWFREELVSLVCYGLDWYGLRQHPSDSSVKVSWRSNFSFAGLEKIKSWDGFDWNNIHLKVLWKFHQDLTCFGCFRDDLELVWYGLVWLIWYGLVWFETTSIWMLSESFMKIRLVLAVLEKI